MKRLLTICLVLLLCASAYSTPIHSDETTKLGSFTGPVGGSAQDDNVKASLDLAHTDIDAIIRDFGIRRSTNGSIFYVDAGTAGATGISWATAVADIEAATVLCTADVGDIIVCAPGHVEAMTAADDIDIDKNGIILISLGTGEQRTTLTYTTNGEFVIGADDVEVHGFNFIAGNAVVHAIDVETGAENWIINDCRFWTTVVNTDEFIDCIDVAAVGDNGKVTNCQVEMGAASAVSFITNVGSDYVEIADNFISGDFSTANIVDVTTASIWLNIHDNILINGTVGGTAGLNTVACISLKADSSAIITDNKLFCNVATPDLAIVAADGLLSGNTYGQAEGTFVGSVPIGVGANSAAAGIRCAEVTLATHTTDDDLFQVTGGPIIIRDIIAIVQTGGLVATAFELNYLLDPVAPATATSFATDGTALECNGDAEGSVYIWDGVVATDLAVTTNGVIPTQGWDVSAGLLCPIGMIETEASATNAGDITYYLVYSPLSPLSVVTPQ